MHLGSLWAHWAHGSRLSVRRAVGQLSWGSAAGSGAGATSTVFLVKRRDDESERELALKAYDRADLADDDAFAVEIQIYHIHFKI